MDLADIERALKDGFIVYMKYGKIEMEKAPRFGDVTLKYQDGDMVYLTKTETKK